MNESEKSILYMKAWAKWGDLQLIMLIEEPSELIKAVTKFMRDKSNANGMHICEEIADVEIVCEQYRQLSPDMNNAIAVYKEEKLQRLKRLLDVQP
jgi:hypothetical protein